MTDTQLVILLAAIWIAPHADRWFARAASLLFVGLWIVLTVWR